MTAKLVKMEVGEFAWQVAGIPGSGTNLEELAKWQRYDFVLKKWVPGKDYCMFLVMYPYPEPGRQTFLETLQSYVDELPSEATVYYYSNECFGALRPIL